MIVVIAAATVHPDKLEEAKALATEVERATRQEQGCISYRFVQSIEDPHQFLAFSEWRTEANVDSHFQQAHTQTFLTAITPLLTSEVNISRYNISFCGPL